MGEIAPAVSADADANGYTAIHTKLTALQRAAEQLMEHAERVALRMRANARAAVTVADLSAAAQVDARHVALINEVATSSVGWSAAPAA
ncbi:Conjugal transfer protein TraB OS=Streptomyces tendae OX=1932 GN=GUR47_38350 PE=4 SV=1 [Streptomyces tendae]